jgi:hypothetical protein
MGLLGASITLAILRSFSHAKSVSFSYCPSIRKKACQLGIAGQIKYKMKSKELL